VQVLSTEVSNRMKEYAVLKAMARRPLRIWHRRCAGRASWFGRSAARFVRRRARCCGSFRTARSGAALGAVVFGKMLAITLAAALGAAAVVVGRVHRADPAALY